MSAVDEYNKLIEDCQWTCAADIITSADAAIAELEAEKKHLSAENENMAALLKSYRDDYVPRFVEDGLKQRAEQAEAELAALKGRRCTSCEQYREAIGHDKLPNGHHYCYLGVKIFTDKRWWLPPDFACNRWAERGTGCS